MDNKREKTNSLNALWNQVDDESQSQEFKRTSSSVKDTQLKQLKIDRVNKNTSSKQTHQNQAKVQDWRKPSSSRKNGYGGNSSWNKYQSSRVEVQDLNKGSVKKKNDLQHQGKNKHFQQNNSAGPQTSKQKPVEQDYLPQKGNDNVLHPKRELRPMSLVKLQALVTKSTSEILLTIANEESGFSKLLEKEIKRDMMAYVIIALGKAVDCYMNNNVTEMILRVTSNSNFFLVKLQQYLVSFQLHKSQDYHLTSLLRLSEFLHKFQITLPSNAADMLLILLPLLKQTCEKYLIDDKELYCATCQKLEEIEEQNSLVLEKYNATEIKQASHKEKLHLMKPPEDYRSIPVMPNASDILQECPFLRPNLVKGKYQDTDHYLDVQYRLLREDYVRPLRDGIAEYLKLKKQGKSVKQCRTVRVYPDVQIVKEDFVNGGLVHMAFFNDQNFSKIKWDFSKRLLSGSLLCFSSNDFKTMLFASVARRDTKELSKKLLLVRFEELTDEVLNISPLTNFVVIETSAYFEAYRHNLKALHELNEANLPMKHYILEIQKNIQKPSYLNENTNYDMRPLLLPLNCQNLEVKMNKLPPQISEKTKSVNILNEKCWPSADELNLDPSQYAALKAAVTKEFSVIQGPPGTGKTHVGLKIAQVLLHNIKQWRSDSDQLPILVICYTNHALDQFLEGLLLFTKKLVRVGGRGINESISHYQLNNLKKTIKQKREVPNYIFSSINQQFFHLKCLRRDVEKVQKTNQKNYKSVLKDNDLADYMSANHLLSLRSAQMYLSDDGYFLHDWLEIRIRDMYSEGKYSMQNDMRMNEEKKWVPYSEREWELQHGKVKLQRHIAHCLMKRTVMSEKVANATQDIWNLPIEHKWCLYKYWVECYIKEKEIVELQQGSQKKYEKLCKMPVLKDNDLVDYMSPNHLLSLKSAKTYLRDDGYFLYDWLGIRIRDDKYSMQHGHKQQHPLFSVIPKPTAEEIFLENDEDSEAEADIDYIENQRAIDPDEYKDVSYDLPMYQEESEWVPYSEGEWKQQGGKKELQRHITHCLMKNIALLKKDADTIRDIWSLPIEHRWCLYKYWLECYTKEKEKEIFELQQGLRKEYEKLCEMRTEEDIHVCKQAYVVGMTTTGASKYRHIVQHLNPKILIVEEAAEILESHIVTSLAPGTEHVILIGDHQQLRPSPTVHMLAVKYDLNISLFERMVENGIDCHRLELQHRMRPEIAALISPHIYDNLQNHKSVNNFENIKGVSKNVFFVSHTCNELQENDSKSKVNKHEAKFMIRLCKYFIMQGYNSSQITVLTTYSGQLFEMKRLNAQGILKDVKFTVVDNYQGEENDIILISFVRSNDDGQIGFLKTANRVCVALSRAKKGLFCIGNFELLAEQSELWKNIVGQLEKDKAIGSSLQLTCQNHPGVSSVVATDTDFDSVPEGGCARKCEFRLSCGHVCQLLCHPYDPEHEEIKCQKPCSKFCEKGHPCKRKCSQDCGDCQVVVTKTLEECGHTIDVECYMQYDEVDCTKLCDKYLECGHMCTNLCYDRCVTKCVEKVRVTSKFCGHKVIVQCYNYDNLDLLPKICREPCREELACGHMCRGTCSLCHRGRIHISCRKPCKRILVCGHECQSFCSNSCPPCDKPCENKCKHSKCPKKCGEPCKKCTEPCDWSCEHEKCSRLCGEQCDRTACDEPCLKLLECQHPCIGLCGEPCPKECKTCDEDKVKEIFFGSEDEVNARFIRLEDCNHIFELSGITQWMKRDVKDKREIQMKTCPKCKVVVRRNLRFGNIVKSCLEDIEKVKKITFGVASQNMASQKRLLKKLKDAEQTWKISLMCKPLIEVLASDKTNSVQAVTTMENIVNILIPLSNISKSIREDVDREVYISFIIRLSANDVKDSVKELKDYIKGTIKWLTTIINRVFQTASEQQLQELTWEVHRLQLANSLLKCLQTESQAKSNPELNSLLKCVMSDIPFREEDSKRFISELESYVKSIQGAHINVSTVEKQSILKAMGLSKGHWYQCPNGHVYCITECGGAMQESKCNECGENIGGTQHRLLSTNRVATAMDGAQHSVWSDAMNMENYQLNDIV